MWYPGSILDCKLRGLKWRPRLGVDKKGLIDCQVQELIGVVLSEEAVGDVGSLAEYPVSAPVKVCCRCPSHASDIHRLIESRRA